jgi:hypothetical protein
MARDEPTGFGPESGAGEQESSESRAFAAGPALLMIAAGALVLSGALLIPGGVLTHIAGYVCAAGIAFTAVAINRRAIIGSDARVDRRGSRPGAILSVVLLLTGFALAIGHAWLIARRYG